MSYDPRSVIDAKDSDGGDVQAALNLAMTLPTESKIANVYIGAHGQVWDLRSYTDPTRQRAIRVAQTSESFVELVNSLQETTSRVFADVVGYGFDAVLDFGTAPAPTRDEHHVVFSPRQHPEWQAWASLHGKPIEQVFFADFIEEHLDSVIEPDGADLLDIVQTIKGHRGISFKTAHRLVNGETKITYDETLTTSGGTGEVTLPNTLKVRTPIFRDEAVVEFVAFLRYRIGDSGQITFTIKIQKADDIVPDAFALIIAKVAERVAPIVVSAGGPGRVSAGTSE